MKIQNYWRKNKIGHDWTTIRDYDEYKKFWKGVSLNDKEIKKFRAKSEIAYLRRNCWSETIHQLYKFLYCEVVDGGCSGNGSFVIVDIDTLKEAKEKIEKSKFDKIDKKDYLGFIKKCIKYCKSKNKEGVIINFG